jgi:hypothetical protein
MPKVRVRVVQDENRLRLPSRGGWRFQAGDLLISSARARKIDAPHASRAFRCDPPARIYRSFIRRRGIHRGERGEIPFHCYARNAGEPSAKETDLTEIR